MTFKTSFHGAVTDSMIVPFSLAQLAFLHTCMGISKTGNFGAIIGCREYSDLTMETIICTDQRRKAARKQPGNSSTHKFNAYQE